MRSAFDNRQMTGVGATKKHIAYMQMQCPNTVPAAKARYMGEIVELVSRRQLRAYQRLKKKVVYYRDVIQTQE